MSSCKYCHGSCVKAGFQKSKVQKYYCKICKKYQQAVYKSTVHHGDVNQRIVTLLVEGVGLRGIARVLRIALKTVISRIRKIARAINKPFHPVKGGIYEIDELWTYIGRKTDESWITYCIDRENKVVINFKVGARTKKNITEVTEKVLSLFPRKVCTDGLNSYKSLIPASLHSIGLSHTRRIERFNLNLRTHLKRLSRKTICFSRNVEMLEACLKIYFWKRPFDMMGPLRQGW